MLQGIVRRLLLSSHSSAHCGGEFSDRSFQSLRDVATAERRIGDSLPARLTKEGRLMDICGLREQVRQASRPAAVYRGAEPVAELVLFHGVVAPWIDHG